MRLLLFEVYDSCVRVINRFKYLYKYVYDMILKKCVYEYVVFFIYVYILILKCVNVISLNKKNYILFVLKGNMNSK